MSPRERDRKTERKKENLCTFIEPNVGPPFHCHDVAKPMVRQLMSDDLKNKKTKFFLLLRKSIKRGI